MSAPCQLPLWLHRIFNGVLPAVLLVALSSFWIGEPDGSWRHLISRGLLLLSGPVGIIFAAITQWFSVVEGAAGEVGYEQDEDGKE